MSTVITFPQPDGANFTIPAVGDQNWGQNVTNFLVAIPNGVVPRSGLFALTGDVSFGPTFGLISAYFKSATTHPASAGAIRLAFTDSVVWRNNVNNADVDLSVNSSNLLAFNGNVVITGPIVNSQISNTAAISVSKLASGTDAQALQMNGTGTTPQWLDPTTVNVKSFGAKGDGSTDDTTAIQNAINFCGQNYTLGFPGGTYNISSALQLVYGCTLIGSGRLGFSGANGTEINQTNSAVPVFLFVNTSAGPGSAEFQSIGLSNLSLNGGTDSLYAQNGGVGVTLRNLFCAGFSGSGLHLRGFVQNWVVDNISINPFNAGYGIKFTENGLEANNVTVGTTFLCDKNAFYNTYINGGINAINIDAGTHLGDLNTFVNTTLQATQQDGMILKGAFRNTTFVGLSTEILGQSGPTPANSTATTTASSASVSVASGTNFVNGQTVTIQGAGTNGVDWYPVISSGGGTTTLVMTTTAPSAVTSAPITNNIYAEIIIGVGTGGSSSPVCTIFQGYEGSFGNTRYSVDLSNTLGGTTFINCLLNVPVYDPFNQATIIGQSHVQVVNAQNYKGQQLFGPTFPVGSNNSAWATLLGTPLGRDLCFGLVDSNGVGTGTFGNFTFRKSSTGLSVVAPEVAHIDSSGNSVFLGSTTSANFISSASNPASSGTIRIADTDTINWRNHANNSDDSLSKDTSDNLLWNGSIIATRTAGPVTSITGTANEIIASGSTGNITLSTPQAIGTGSSPTFAGLTLSSPLTAANGGTGQTSAAAAYNALSPMTTTGDIEIETSANTAARLAIGSAGQVLTVVTGKPAWATPVGTGTVNSGTATHLAYYATSTAAVSDTPAFYTANSNANGGIVGTVAADNAVAGSVGEYVQSVVTSPVNDPNATTQWFDVTSISLTAGDWDITWRAGFTLNGAVCTHALAGIGTTSGNSTAGMAEGNNLFESLPPTSVTDTYVCIANYRVNISTTTTYYAKERFDFSAGTPQGYGTICARRIR